MEDIWREEMEFGGWRWCWYKAEWMMVTGVMVVVAVYGGDGGSLTLSLYCIFIMTIFFFSIISTFLYPYSIQHDYIF